MSDEEKAPDIEGDAEFSSTFAEITRQRAGQPSEEAPDSPGERPDPQAKETEAGPSEAPDGEPAPPQEAAAEGPAAEENSDDLWANADPRLREAFEAERKAREKAEQQTRTQNGRLSQVNHELNDLRRRLSSKQDETAKTPKGGEAEDEDERIKQLREEYPQVAEPLLEKIAKLEARQRDLEGAEQSRVTAQTQQQLYEQQSILEQAHPDFMDVVRSQEWADWYGKQPLYIQKAIQENGQHIVDGNSTAEILTRFKRDAGLIKETAAPEPQAAARRERQLEASKSVKATQPAVVAEPAADFESTFARLAAKRTANSR